MRPQAAILILAAVAALAGPGCRRAEEPHPALLRPAGGRTLPNIILLTVDTLRADHMALYGYGRDTMPAVEAFAQTAVVFDNAVVPRGSTRPSYASMLTGLYPFRHGVRSNGMVLHQDVTTLAEVLRSVGYHTAGFVSNFVLVGELSGFNQGFDVYDDRIAERELNRSNYERTATNTLKAILQWLETDPRRPFFLFTNFIDPHGPYHPPERFRRLFRCTEQRTVPADRIPAYQRIEGVTDYFEYVGRYDGEIRYVDRAISILIDQLKSKGLWDDSVVIFTADHGESLGEHGIYFEHHFHVWEETVRVPLAIRLPGSADEEDAARPRRVPALCSPMDLPPTLYAYLGLPLDGQFDGRNLLGMLRQEGGDDRSLLLEFPDVATPHMSLPDIFAVRTTTHKLIRTLEADSGRVGAQAVLDLVADPAEQQPIEYDAHNPQHRALAGELDSLLAQLRGYQLPFPVTEYEMPHPQRTGFVKGRQGRTARIVKTLTDDQIQKLRSLGYVD